MLWTNRRRLAWSAFGKGINLGAVFGAPLLLQALVVAVEHGASRGGERAACSLQADTDQAGAQASVL